jgi:tetratricopeptide (TPR) repeat protein
VPGATAPRQPPRISPLVPIGVAAAVAGAVLAIVLAGGGDGERRAASSSTTPRTATQAARARTQATTPPPVQAAQAEQPAQTATAPASGGSDSSSSKDPSALNDEGHALSQEGNYEAAVPLLRASVDGYRNAGRTKEIGYAYALFNLAVALTHSGDAAGAIDLLRERLRYPDQRPKVRQELEDAQAQLEGTGATTQP